MPKILVVDDDRSVQEMLGDLLGGEGYETGTCRDGNQVIDELGRANYDLLILDVLIPHKNGFVLIEEIRADPALAELPVIMISGIYRSRNHRTEMTTRHKVIEYLDKPLNTDKLLELVKNVVGKGSLTPGAVPHNQEVGGITHTEQLDEESGEFVNTADIIDVEDLTLSKARQQPVKLTQKKAQQTPVALTQPKKKVPSSPTKTEIPPEPSPAIVDSSAREERKMVESEARQSFRTSAFVLQGSIKKTPVVAILGKLWYQRASGGLLLRNSKIKKIVYLREGNPYLVKSNLVGECLGQILLRERLINKSECEESLEQMKLTGKKQGEILVQMGCLTKKNLLFALELQLETKLFETFVWDAGEYRFNASMKLKDASTVLDWTGPSVVVDGIRQTFDETRLRSLMLPVIDVALERRERIRDYKRMHFTDKERKAIQAMHLPKTTRELLHSMPLDPPDSLRVIYTLIALEILGPAA